MTRACSHSPSIVDDGIQAKVASLPIVALAASLVAMLLGNSGVQRQWRHGNSFYTSVLYIPYPANVKLLSLTLVTEIITTLVRMSYTLVILTRHV